MQEVDVLVVGAGPTGLMMAAEILRHGLTCRLIDQDPLPPHGDQSRALAIQARTLEIFSHLGMVEAFLEQGLKVIAANPISQGRPLSRVTFDALESPYQFVLSLEQAKTERILEEYVHSQGGRVERGVEFVSLTQDANGVDVVLKNGRIRASFVIGCDGAHSAVRKELDLPFLGKAFVDVFSLADLHVHWPYPHNELFVFLNAKGLLAAIPMSEKNRYRLVFQRKEAPTEEPTLQEVERLLRGYAGAEVSVRDPVWMANFHIHSRMVNAYQKGRVFLAGDAAHIHSPVGGQGMNTGLQDAFNLAWKIALVHQGEAPFELLSSYDLERRAVGKRLLKATSLASSFATMSHPILIWLRNRLVSLLLKAPWMRAYLTKIISQTAIRYSQSTIVVERAWFKNGPKAGERAPEVPLIHLLGQGPFLLLFCGKKEIDLPHACELSDLGAVAHRAYGVKKTATYLIRPDFYIGYRSRGLDDKVQFLGKDVKIYVITQAERETF
jgi:2-polyprenyl-6-methoxyphenol hydroxylase-like FAD-dependent oxidoreductase